MELINPYLTLSLLVLERTVHENDARVFDPPPHLGVSDVLVQHHTLQYLRLLQAPPRDLGIRRGNDDVIGIVEFIYACVGMNLLHFSISLDVYFFSVS